MKTTAVRHDVFDQDGCLRGMIFISSLIPNGKQGLINFDFELQWSVGHTEVCAWEAALITERTAAVGTSVFWKILHVLLTLLLGEVLGTGEGEHSSPDFALLQERCWARTASDAASARAFPD